MAQDHTGAKIRSRLTMAILLVLGATAAVVAGLSPASARPVPRAVCNIVLQPDSYSTPQDTVLNVPNIGVSTNDTLCGSDGLVISTSQPTHGQLTKFDDDSGGFTYTPNSGFTGTDSFMYTTEDVQGIQAVTVTITVSAVESSTTTTTTMPMATTTTTMGTTSTTSTVPTATSPASQPATPVAATPAFTG